MQWFNKTIKKKNGNQTVQGTETKQGKLTFKK